MVFRGIPDAERNRHPYLAWLFELGFDFTIISVYRRELHFPPDFCLPPGTILISNHQRDADAPILGTALCQRRGLRFRWPLPFFAGREDLFRRGFLAEYVASWPPPVPQVLGWIPLSWLFAILRTQPIRRVREFSTAETLDAVLAAGLGERAPTTILNARGQRELGSGQHALPAQLTALHPRTGSSVWGLRRLRKAARRALVPAFRDTLAAQLRGFAALLDAGHAVYFSPEGVISADGRFGRVRGGLRQLCRLAAAAPRLLPVALSYDGLGPGRLRVIMQVGELLKAPDTTDRAGFSAAVRAAVLQLLHVNPSHLLAAYLAAGPASFTTGEFLEWWQRALAVIGQRGLRTDPLLTQAAANQLPEQRLRWLQRKALVRLTQGRWQSAWPRETRAGWQTPARRVAYFANAFGDLMSDWREALSS